MLQAWFPIVLLLLVLGLLPLALKWLQRRVAGLNTATVGANRIVSAVGVGPQQRVVTVEVGPQNNRTWLTLGVTPQTITCLHSTPVTFDHHLKTALSQDEPAYVSS
jgi:flagellar protein FliO/FliZ